MDHSSPLHAGHRQNHPIIRSARHHALRQLVSRPEIQLGPIDTSHANTNTVATPIPVKPVTNVITAGETHTTPSPAAPAPLPVTPPTNTVSVSPHLVTPTPVVRIANVPQATATSAIPSKTSLPLSPCSAGVPCASMIAKSAAVVSPVPQQTQGTPQFFASMSSSPGAIFVTCLVGIAIVGVMLSILSCALRSWCNRRRRSNIDEDAWRFLENSKDFSDPTHEEEDAHSAKKSYFGTDSQSSLAHLQPTLAKNYVASHPFTSHIQQQTQQATAQYHYTGFPAQSASAVNGFIDEQPMSGYIDEKGVCWVAPPAPVSSQCNGILMTPCGPPQERMESYQGGCTIPELVFRKTSLGGNFCNRATMYASPTQAPVPMLTRPASVITRTSTISSNQHNRLHSLTREASLACSVQSTTVEELRERVTEQRTDLRATLRGAIQKDKKADNDLLESLILLWHDKNTEAQKEPIRLQTPQLPPKDHA
ncbi:hypothetical protein PGT21_002425 [Puccinia graminis f. sp. tritici]|uniref:Uncharacterized protein n=1 Tax=Puccinia graminis f. sp. tritici TaxID=56615 RepID=A0A5B0PH47_PUCGR|nr:hypothetical protein PGT21_002425 [Puccinia graminis f. sp. tritici]